MPKIKAGVLGCTGTVGQNFISLLSNHPYFELAEIAASESSAGSIYQEKVNWKQHSEIPEKIANLKIKKCSDEFSSGLLFSALDASVAGEIEHNLANKGHAIVSNSRNHRMEKLVPLVIPEINSDHIDIVKHQEYYKSSKGFIVTNPNCSTVVLAITLHALKKLTPEKVIVTTMQAISGAGYPGVPSLDILGNLIPFISGEEEKMETETNKILGSYSNNSIQFNDLIISASCNRVSVETGHSMSVSVKFKTPPQFEDIIEAFSHCVGLDLPSSPEKLIHIQTAKDRPQPKLDASSDKGMAIHIGNIRKCNVLDWKFTAMGNNLIRGAAGAAVLNAEILYKEGYLK